jgi:hypothetical protein
MKLTSGFGKVLKTASEFRPIFDTFVTTVRKVLNEVKATETGSINIDLVLNKCKGRCHDQADDDWIVVRRPLRGHDDMPFGWPTTGRPGFGQWSPLGCFWCFQLILIGNVIS